MARSGLLLAASAVPLGLLLAAPAQGDTVSAAAKPAPTASKTVTVADVAEAWYADSPVDVCTAPLGCPPADTPTSPYPADTLHVGVAGGQETARTYLQPDLLAVPFGATVLHAAMTLPVGTGQGDGTQSPGAASVVACLATGSFTDGTAGSASTPPKTDCATLARASYDAKHHVFTLDATPLLKALAAGSGARGIALIADLRGGQPTDAWHVAFNGHKRAGAHHISTAVTFVAPPPADYGATAATTPVNTQPPGGTGATVPPSLTSVGLPSQAAATTPGDAAPLVAAQQPAAAAVAQQPVVFSAGFQYPLAFLLPLGLLAGAIFFARLFTRDATPMRLQ